jgi:restriction endonuclease S subunit
MQYSIVNTNDLEGEFRLDPEYYHPQYLLADKLISKKNFQVLEKLSSKITDFGAYSQNNIVEYLNKGYAVFIRNQDVKNFFLNDSSRIYISKDVYNQLSLHLEKFDIVVQRVGTLGKAAIVLEKDLPSTANQNLAQIKVDKNLINPFYLIAFLNCKYGIDYFERLQTGNVQPWLNLQQIKGLKIPLFSEKLQEKISSLVEKSFLYIQQSKDDFRQAQQILLAELGMLDWSPKHKLTFIKDFSSQDIDRIDAEYHQPKYDEIARAIKNYGGDWDILDNLVTLKKSVEVGSDEYLDDGDVPFIRVSNLSLLEITQEKFISEELYTELIDFQPKQGEILLSKDGTAGIAYYLRDKPAKMIPSGGILRLELKNKRVNADYLTLVLNSLLTQEQINRDVGGSIILHWRPDQVKQTLIPIVDEKMQKEIEKKMSAAFMHNTHSRRLLEWTKHAIEIAIEQNEKSALNWLDNQFSRMEREN